MIYDKDTIFQQAIEIVQNDENVVFIADVVSKLPCAQSTFYEYFPASSEQMEYIKAKLVSNRTSLKQKLRKSWLGSGSAPLELALYKLMADGDELKALSMQQLDHTSNGKTLTMPTFLQPDETTD